LGQGAPPAESGSPVLANCAQYLFAADAMALPSSSNAVLRGVLN
jgi:hypothetical protein